MSILSIITAALLCHMMWVTCVRCAPTERHTRHTRSVRDAVEPVTEVMFKVNKTLTFHCSDRPVTSSVHWFLDGFPIDERTNEWLDTWFIDSVNVHLNTIRIAAKTGSGPVSTLLCKIDGPYRENIVNMYHVIKAVDKAPSETILRGSRDQECPLHPGHILTLNCAPGLRFVHPHRWNWFRNDVFIGGATSAHIRVTEPGKYRCIYKKHKHHAIDLLEFNVQETSGSPRQSTTWTFCSYSRRMTTW